MNRFIDITACLFQPPGWNPQADELVFRPNERLEVSMGDIEEHSRVSDKIGGYNPKKIQTMNKENDDQFTPDGLESMRSLQIKPQTLASPVQAKPPIIRKMDKDMQNVSKSISIAPHKNRQNPAIGLPYIVINQVKPEEEEFTLIYFHANSEDIFRCLRVCRMLSDYMRVGLRKQAKIIIPEYRGYSQLKSYASDMEMIKTDMRFFVKELEKRGVINISKTILFVRAPNVGSKPWFSHCELPFFKIFIPLMHSLLWFPKCC